MRAIIGAAYKWSYSGERLTFGRSTVEICRRLLELCGGGTVSSLIRKSGIPGLTISIEVLNEAVRLVELVN